MQWSKVCGKNATLDADTIKEIDSATCLNALVESLVSLRKILLNGESDAEYQAKCEADNFMHDRDLYIASKPPIGDLKALDEIMFEHATTLGYCLSL